MPGDRSVLVTGVAGYIGSHLSRQLIEQGYRVIGIDCLLFGARGISDLHENQGFQFVHGDIRDPNSYRSLLERVDAVVHLAAIVGDPACKQRPELAQSTNLEASIRLFDEACKASGPRRFVFASTCSNNGVQQNTEYCEEECELEPVSLYATTKVSTERYVLNTKTRADFLPTCLRFATAYGLSPRMRFDLTVNEFTREVARVFVLST